MASKGIGTRIAVYVGIAVVLAALGYLGAHSWGRAALLGGIGLLLGVIYELASFAQNKGALPELRHDGYGVQTPSWYEREHEKDGESEDGAAEAEASDK